MQKSRQNKTSELIEERTLLHNLGRIELPRPVSHLAYFGFHLDVFLHLFSRRNRFRSKELPLRTFDLCIEDRDGGVLPVYC